MIELLVVMAIISILGVMMFGGMHISKEKARLALCVSRLRQINLGLVMYSDDANDKAPCTPGTTVSPGLNWTGYKKLMQSYVGLDGVSSNQDNRFACPSDKFHYDVTTNFGRYVPQSLHDQPPDFLSYAFNGGNARTNSNAPGIAGRALASIKDPAKSVLLAEAPALIPYSWHKPKRPLAPENAIFNDAMNVISFVDGHAAYLKIHWGGNNPPGSMALHQDPPAGYAYKWSGD